MGVHCAISGGFTMRMKIASILLLASVMISHVSGQQLPASATKAPSPVLLELSVVNRAFYLHDQPDYSKLASDPNPVFPIGILKTFIVVTGLGDIAQMNGQPAKGNFVAWFTLLNLTPQPEPGQAIADVTRFAIVHYVFEILDADGNPLGSITVEGLADGPTAPGAPPQFENGNGSFVITGGTGIFKGARGQAAERTGIFGRPASTNEDPSYRRQHWGGTAGAVFAFIRNSCPYARVDEN
jgi:hypothetical protein